MMSVVCLSPCTLCTLYVTVCVSENHFSLVLEKPIKWLSLFGQSATLNFSFGDKFAKWGDSFASMHQLNAVLMESAKNFR